MSHPVALVPGDGIGPEIAAAVRRILDAAGVPIQWVHVDAGLGAIEQFGRSITDDGIRTLREVGVALKGPTTTPVGGGHSSVNVLIRKMLGLYANVRMVRSLPGVTTRYSNIDIVVIRENVEDTYGGIEYMQTPDVALGFKFISRQGSENVARYAFEYARATARRKVTCVHKANIHKMADGMFLNVFREVAAQYPDIEANDVIVDNACMQLVTRPEQYDVMLLPNLYGDIVSDLCAGLIGGLGVAPGSNIGPDVAIFEAVHGSAPDIAGKGVANPTALLQSAIHMLRYIGEADAADTVENALFGALADGRKTRDLGGELGTDAFADAIIQRLDPVRTDRGLCPQRLSPRPPSAGVVPERRMVGVDVYVEAASFPTFPAQVGAFACEGCANRGMQLSGADAARSETINWWRLRYLADGPVSDAAVGELLAQIGQQHTWVQVQKLYEFDGKKAFAG
jgi:NAD-dependent isocitrate dehydrogenase